MLVSIEIDSALL